MKKCKFKCAECCVVCHCISKRDAIPKVIAFGQFLKCCVYIERPKTEPKDGRPRRKAMEQMSSRWKNSIEITWKCVWSWLQTMQISFSRMKRVGINTYPITKFYFLFAHTFFFWFLKIRSFLGEYALNTKKTKQVSEESVKRKCRKRYGYSVFLCTISKVKMHPIHPGVKQPTFSCSTQQFTLDAMTYHTAFTFDSI